MDIEKNPGPAILSNFGVSSFVDSRIVNFNSHLESSPLSLSSHLLMGFNSYANPILRFVYSRDELFSIRFGSTRLKLSPRLLSHLKVNSLLRYRGKRAGKSKRLQSDDRAIPVLNRPRQMITLWRARTRTLTSLINCDSSRLPAFSRLKPTATRFALFNARSVRNKRLLIKDYVVDNDVDIFALTETWLHSDNRDDQVIGDLIPVGYSFYHVPRQFGNGGGVSI